MRGDNPKGPPGLMDRRDFLKLGGAGLPVMALLVTTGAHYVMAQEGSSLIEEVEVASD